jgi:hypothetical protein
MKPATLACAAAALLQVGCSTGSKPESFFVVVPPTEAERYYGDMIGVVSQHGLDPNPGTASNPWGSTLYVVEGKGRGVRVWSINVLLSENESLACGGPKASRSDPSQFVVTVSNRSLFGGDQVSMVTSELVASLRAKGYDVRASARRCAGGTGAN